MSDRLKIALIIIGVVFILVLGQVIWNAINNRSNSGKTELNPVDTEQATDNQTQDDQLLPTDSSIPTTGLSAGQAVSIIPKDNPIEKKIVGVALPFASVFGSYSNQSDFENFRDLRYFMTDKMNTWVDNYIVQYKSATKPKAYFGVTTKALKAEIESVNSNEAVVTVKTQRKESTGTKSNYRIYYQDLELDFKNIGGAWKVDGAYWK